MDKLLQEEEWKEVKDLSNDKVIGQLYPFMCFS